MPANTGAQKQEIKLLQASAQGAELTRTTRVVLAAPQKHKRVCEAAVFPSSQLLPCGFPAVLFQVLNEIWRTLFSALAAGSAWKGASLGCLTAPHSIFCKFAASCQRIIRVIFVILGLYEEKDTILTTT